MKSSISSFRCCPEGVELDLRLYIRDDFDESFEAGFEAVGLAITIMACIGPGVSCTDMIN